MLQLFAIVAIFGIASADSINYCDSNLCPSGLKHIACGNSGSFDSKCPKDRKLIDFSESAIKLVLDHHNKYRNKIANGDQIGFFPATRMATMTWNAKLAQLAALNVMQCKMKHDQCRSTKKFKYAGQNLALRANSGVFEPLDTLIEKNIKGWYDEVNNAAQSDIDNCCTSKSGKTIGHFIQVVTDRAIQVGCAASQYTHKEWKTSLMTCNYALTNMIGQKVYLSGTTASGCSSGVNPDYPALCKDSEDISVAL